MDWCRNLLLCGLLTIQKLTTALPYSHSDLSLNNYGNFGYPFKTGNNYGLLGGSYSRPPLGSSFQNGWAPSSPGNGRYPIGPQPLNQLYLGPGSGFNAQQNQFGSGLGLINPAGSGFQIMNSPQVGPPLGIGGGGGAFLPQGSQPAFVSNNNQPFQQLDGPALGSQFAGSPSFISNSNPSFVSNTNPSFLSNSGNNPSFVQNQPVISSQNFAQPVDDQQFGIVPDVQPNNLQFQPQASVQSQFSPGGSLGNGFSNSGSSGGFLGNGNNVNSIGGGSVGLGTVNSQNSVFSSPGLSGPSFTNSQTSPSGSTADIFASVLHSLGI